MIIKCPYGIGDSAVILPKLAVLADENRIDYLTYYLTGYYPHLLYRFFINFDFGVPARYILTPHGIEDDPVDVNVIEVHPMKVHCELKDIPDVVVPERYWERFPYLTRYHGPDIEDILGQVQREITRLDRYGYTERLLKECMRKFRVNKLASDIILSEFIRHKKKQDYPVIFQPFTSLRTPRNFKARDFMELYRAVISVFEGVPVCLVGTYTDYLHIKDIVDSNLSDNIFNMMGQWDVAEVVQAIFDAGVVVGCNSWVSYLGALLDKRSVMYVLGSLGVETEFQGRVVSENFWGFENIALSQNLDINAMVEFLKG